MKMTPTSHKALQRRSRLSLCALLCLLLALPAVLSSCSTKKNTAASRNWHAFNTRYNVYYNGNEHLKETLKEMENKYEDDYTQTLLMHPADARAYSKMPQPSGDFTRSIEKAQKAIQLHSIQKKPAKKTGSKKEKEFREREEFNPFLHNAWLMMAQAQYYNGDYAGAAATFFYISRHFTWLPEVVTEARLWQARAYCAQDWLYEAENILQRITPAMLTTKKLNELYDFVQADFYVKSKDYRQAIPYLEKSAQVAKGGQKNRLYFLLGQLLAMQGNNNKAYDAFKKAAGGMATDYRTKFNARIKQTEVFTGANIKNEVNSLKSLARYSRNKEFLDQIYYAIGNLYLSRRDTAEAKSYYALAVEKSTRNGIDQALANLALGTIYFNEGNYAKAQPCYSAAVPMLPETYPDYKLLKKRSDVLDELATYSGNVQLQDSLLELSAMSESEQMKVCERLAEEYTKKEKEMQEAARRERDMQEAEAAKSAAGGTDNTQSFTMATAGGAWYFYNPSVKNAGKAEFQRRWGSRKLEDDWRRRNKNSFSFDDYEDETPVATADDLAEDAEDDDPNASDADKDAKLKARDPHEAIFYYNRIPHTEAEIRNSNNVVQEGLYNMGVILKDKLEDFPAARKEFNELDERYPDNIYRLDVYYNLYLMAVREDDAVEADRYRRLILEEFPYSPYGQAMQDPDYFNKLRQMNARQEGLYEEAYADYLANNNSGVHAITEEMERDYPLSKILPKFVFIDALSYLTEKDYDKFRSRLQTLLEKWPDTDMTDMASGILKGLNEGRTPHAGISNSRPLLWETRLSELSEQPKGADGLPANFDRDPMKPHFLVLAFPRDSINANRLLYEVARFNFSTFTIRDFELEQMSFGNVGLLIIKGFENLQEVENYRKVMAREGLDLSPLVRPIVISKPNFELMLREGRSFEEYFRFQEEEAVEQAEKSAEPPEDPKLPDNPETPAEEEALAEEP